MIAEHEDRHDGFWAWLRGHGEAELTADPTPAEAEARLASAPERPLRPGQVARIVAAATAAPVARPWWGRPRLAAAAVLLVSVSVVAGGFVYGWAEKEFSDKTLDYPTALREAADWDAGTSQQTALGRLLEFIETGVTELRAARGRGGAVGVLAQAALTELETLCESGVWPRPFPTEVPIFAVLKDLRSGRLSFEQQEAEIPQLVDQLAIGVHTIKRVAEGAVPDTDQDRLRIRKTARAYLYRVVGWLSE